MTHCPSDAVGRNLYLVFFVFCLSDCTVMESAFLTALQLLFLFLFFFVPSCVLRYKCTSHFVLDCHSEGTRKEIIPTVLKKKKKRNIVWRHWTCPSPPQSPLPLPPYPPTHLTAMALLRNRFFLYINIYINIYTYGYFGMIMQ